MPVRKLTLEEWFLGYQLRLVKKNTFHLPTELNVDIRRIEAAYSDRGEKVPYSAVLVKAVALLARRCPGVNRMVFSTFYGKRMVEFESVDVNVPLLMDAGSGRFVFGAELRIAV